MALIFIGKSHITAQPDPKIFNYSDFTWFGLDFSQARFIGSAGFTNPQELKESYLKKWNDLVVYENLRYDLAEAYKMNWQQSDLSIATNRNEKINPGALVINLYHQISKEKIDDIIAHYNPENITEGLGLVYIIEAFNKLEKRGSMYVVFFDIASSEVLWKARFAGRPAGFGLRNYWARSILRVIRSSGWEFRQARKSAYN